MCDFTLQNEENLKKQNKRKSVIKKAALRIHVSQIEKQPFYLFIFSFARSRLARLENEASESDSISREPNENANARTHVFFFDSKNAIQPWRGDVTLIQPNILTC